MGRPVSLVNAVGDGPIWSIHVARALRTLREHRVHFGLLLATLVRLVRKRRIVDNEWSGAKKILVIRLDAIGDLVMTTPIFQGLKLQYPNSKLTAVVQKANRDLLTTNPYVDRILHPPVIGRARIFGGIRRELAIVSLYWKQLRNEHFDIAVQPRVGPDFYEANLLLRLIEAPVSISYADPCQKGIAKMASGFALRSTTRLPAPEAQHEVLSSAQVVEQLTGRAFNPIPSLFLTASDRYYAEALGQRLSAGSTILCIAFGAQAMKRSWPLERWTEVIRILAAHQAISVILVCSSAERRDGERLLSMLDVRGHVVSGAKLREAAACIAMSDLFMGNDSGLAHMAAAVGCPAVVVSPQPMNGDRHSANSPVRFRPWSDQAHVIQPAVGLAPCRGECEALERHCILQISVEQVAQVCSEMLQSLTHHVVAKVGVLGFGPI